jgi:hypothetical protein
MHFARQLITEKIHEKIPVCHNAKLSACFLTCFSHASNGTGIIKYKNQQTYLELYIKSPNCHHESVLPQFKNEPQVTHLLCNTEYGLVPLLILMWQCHVNGLHCHVIYCTVCVVSGEVPFWPYVYAYSLSDITETKHEAFTQSTLWPLFKLLPWQCFQQNHGVLMRTHNYIQSGFLLVMQFIFVLHNYGNHLVTPQKWQCL